MSELERAVQDGLDTGIAELALIDQIFEVRVANNIPWKKLMTIALTYAPEETRAVLREINANDRKVSDLLGELAK